MPEYSPLNYGRGSQYGPNVRPPGLNYRAMGIDQLRDLASRGDRQAQAVLDEARSAAHRPPVPAREHAAQTQESIVGTPSVVPVGFQAGGGMPGSEDGLPPMMPSATGIDPAMHAGDYPPAAAPSGMQTFQDMLQPGYLRINEPTAPPNQTAQPDSNIPKITPPAEQEQSVMDKLFGPDKHQAWGDLMRFGLALMKAGEAKPGTIVGPSLLGAVGEAGLSTLDYQNQRDMLRKRLDEHQAEAEKNRQLKRDLARYKAVPGVGLVDVSGEEPRTAVDAADRAPKGFERTPEGGLQPIPGGPADPEYAAGLAAATTPQYSGEVSLDKNVGKFYQVNPKTGKREYISPNEEFTIESDGHGGFRIVKGPSSGTGGLTTGERGKVQGEVRASLESVSRLEGIRNKFKPEFQQIPTRLGAAWTGIKAKLGRGEITPEDKTLLQDFSAYKQEALANLNLYIKETTGAQMSESEANRLRKAAPDPGEGVLGGDDPITFKSKLDNAINLAQMAAIRHAYYLNKGVSNVYEMASKSPLSDMEFAVNKDTGKREYVKIAGKWVPLSDLNGVAK